MTVGGAGKRKNNLNFFKRSMKESTNFVKRSKKENTNFIERSLRKFKFYPNNSKKMQILLKYKKKKHTFHQKIHKKTQFLLEDR